MIANSIDWPGLILYLEDIKGIEITEASMNSLDISKTTEYGIMRQNLIDADYNFSAVEWNNFISGKHFPDNINLEFGKIVNQTVSKSWISQVRPGRCAPYHQDMDDADSSYLKLGKITRYSVFIQQPQFGQGMIVGDTCLYNQTYGFIFKWPDYRDYHAAFNVGLHTQYLFHAMCY
jgi:hypothetical protein